MPPPPHTCPQTDMTMVVESHVSARVNKLCLVPKHEGVALYGGMTTGDVVELQWPVSSTYPIIAGHGLHSDSVTAVHASGDGCFLFSASADGSIFMIALSDEVNAHLGDDLRSHGAAGSNAAALVAQVSATSGKRTNAAKLAETRAVEAIAARRKQLEAVCESGEALVLVPAQAMREAEYRVKQIEDELREQAHASELKHEMLQTKADEELQALQLERAAEKDSLEKALMAERNDRLTLKTNLEEKVDHQVCMLLRCRSPWLWVVMFD